jgi:hypothetical protein
MAAEDCVATARRLRVGARAADDPSIRDDLLAMARHYERLAKREAERRALWTRSNVSPVRSALGNSDVACSLVSTIGGPGGHQ